MNRRVYEVLYKPLGRYGVRLEHKCFYCGDPADTWDHQPPITRVDDYRAQNLETMRYIKVPCCYECNALAADELTNSLIEREGLIKSRLLKRYHKILNTPEWSEEELNELGPSLKESIEEVQKRKERVRHRLEYSEGISFYLEDV